MNEILTNIFDNDYISETLEAGILNDIISDLINDQFGKLRGYPLITLAQFWPFQTPPPSS